MVRIPLGTAVAEETIFRGAVLGLLTQRHPRARAVAVSSALFGCWHVLPTLDTLALNPVGEAVGDDAVVGEAHEPVLAGAVGGGRGWPKTERLLGRWWAEKADGRLRDDCLIANWFLSLADARSKI